MNWRERSIDLESAGAVCCFDEESSTIYYKSHRCVPQDFGWSEVSVSTHGNHLPRSLEILKRHIVHDHIT
jgi:hypothetical protein